MILNLNRKDDCMILKFVSEEKSTFVKGERYFGFEIHISSIDGSILYSLVNSYGEIALYSAEDFEVVKGSLDNMSFCYKGNGIYHVIRLNKIRDLDSQTEFNNGIWGEYHEGNKEVEEQIHSIIMMQANEEGFSLDRINSL